MTNPKTYSTAELAAASKMSLTRLAIWRRTGLAPATIETWGDRTLVRYDEEQAARALILAEFRSRFRASLLRTLASLLPARISKGVIASDGSHVADIGGDPRETRDRLIEFAAVVVINVRELLDRLPHRDGVENA